MRKPVIIESPFKGTPEVSEEEHRHYLRLCIRDCLNRGETPYASHRMLAGPEGALDDADPDQRALGIEAGLDMAKVLTKAGGTVVVYVDYGYSEGMLKALSVYRKRGGKWEERRIHPEKWGRK
jgi:hypothetical protein